MDSENVSTNLHDAFRAMQQQVEAAHATWITALAERRPELAEQLWMLHELHCERQKRSESFLMLLALDPSIPVSDLQQVYDAFGSSAASDIDEPTEDAGVLGYRQRAAQTKRRRTRDALLAAATTLVLEGNTSDLMVKAPKLAGIGVATAYDHFRTKDALIAAVYARLLESK